MNSMQRWLGLFAALLLVIPAAKAEWEDNFDSYAAGSGLNGQGGWECWDNNPAYDALVSDAYSMSAPNSAEILPSTDAIHQFSGYNSGKWIFTAWQYIPANYQGDTYFLLLNTYNHMGPYNWSCQVMFTSDGYMVESYPEMVALPMILDAWVELRIEIDLDMDLQTFYYGGQVLYVKSWVDGVSGGGEVNIGCVDLYGNSASPVYYDDCSLIEWESTPVSETTWGAIKASFR